jgi:glyoxylase-like metal-dependent hydrolase (beta-lactamase superfamily II)
MAGHFKGETMKNNVKIIRLSLLLISLMVSCAATAEETVGLTKLSEHVYAAVDYKNATPAGNSYGANSGVVIGNDAVLVVDTRISAKKAQEFIADIRKVTDKPIKYVVNTHYHLDHSWGNCEFVKLGAVVIGQENGPQLTSRYKEGISHPENYGLTAKDISGTTISPPTITFKDALRVDLGGVTVSLSYLGHTHTNDSIVALVDQDGVLFAGDILFVQYHPTMGEADVQGWLKALAELEKTSAKIIVPGHGPVSTVEDIKEMKIYMEQFDKQAKTLCAGKTQNDAPAIAREMIKVLPDQKRTELIWAIESNLRSKYLPRK